MSDGLERDVRAAVAGPIEDLGLDLESVDVSRSGSKRLLRIAVDADCGVGIDLITQTTRVVSAALDDADAMGQAPYTLEVTSRGLDKPLTEQRHWRRAAGRLVRLTLEDGTTMKGRVVSSDATGVDLTVEPGQAGAEPRRLDLTAITNAVVIPELKSKKDA
ncbi:ribosome maturation factor RimP [Aeromicrobium sp. CTD01-1L150]|uniref:ribosome maturation factor RimP n=1 Tax=Aeromicrobium sp. CTD01-1L150 TaxID=3341830 RepID=UPI0035C261D5